jgi:hypothetical protein
LGKNSATDYDVGWQAPSGTVVQNRTWGIFGGWGTTNSTTYVVISGSGVSITKRFTSTYLELSCGVSGWITAGPGVVTFGLSPTNSGANVTPVAQFYFNNLNTHSHWTGLVALTGIAAGTSTYSWWLKCQSGVSVTSDATDVFWGKLKEIWP